MTSIVLTNTLQNGQLADATEVMADLQQIVNVVNGELDSDNVQDGSLHATDMAVGQAGLASQAVSVRRTATQQINVGATSKVQLNVEDFDLSSVFDAVTNYRYVPTVPGIYRVSASTSWVTFDSWVQTLLYKNGTLLQTLAFARNTLATGGTFGGSCLVQLNGTDYLELFASQGDTANHNMNAAYFCAELVGRI